MNYKRRVVSESVRFFSSGWQWDPCAKYKNKGVKKNGLMSEFGFGLLEIVIVVGIATVALFSFSQLSITSVKLLRQEKENLEATLLSQEGLESARAARDESWDKNIAPLLNGSPYYPVVKSGVWTLATSSPGLLNGKYERYVILEEVRRDAQDRISSAGTLDPGARKITSRISWPTAPAGIPKTIEVVAYLTNFQSALPTQSETKIISFEDAPSDFNLLSFPSDNSGSGDPVQSFTTPGTNLKVSKAEILIKRASGDPSDVFLELRQTNAVGFILGTSNIIDSATLPTNLDWVGFHFPNAVHLNANTKYYLRLRSVPSSNDAGSGSQGLIHWGYKQTSSSPYSGGELRRYVGRLSNTSDQGELLDQYDAGFKIYAIP